MKLYTSAHLLGGHVFLRGYDDEGQRIHHKIKYAPFLFVPSKARDPEYWTLDGKPVDKMRFDDIYEAKEFVKNYEDVAGFNFYGQTDWLRVFLYENYQGDLHYDRSQLNIGKIDIETVFKGRPKPRDAKNKITAITLRVNKHKYYVFGYGNYVSKASEEVVYYKCKDEAHLLMSFLELWESVDLDIITGWNIEGFDIPYIVNRMKIVIGEDMALRLSPWRKWVRHKVVWFGKEEEYEFPMGINVIDYMEAHKKFAAEKTENNKLDQVAFEILGENKIDYSDYGNLDDLYEKNHQLYMDYNVHDVRLVERLDDKLGLLDLILTIAYNNKVLYEDAFTTVRLWDTIIHNHMLNNRMVIPQYQYRDHEEYEGAYVKVPVPGYYRWAVSFDVASEYPSIIMECNISPETYRGMLEQHTGSRYTIQELLEGKLSESDRQYLIDNNLAMTANGALWSREKQGILPQLVEKIFNERQKYRGMMKDAKKAAEANPTEENKALVSKYNNLQLNFKILINAVYGALANEYFRFFRIEAAAGITYTGQLAIRWIEKSINEYLNKVMGTVDKDYCIYVDTDSNYFDLETLVIKCGLEGAERDRVLQFVDDVCKKKLELIIKDKFAELAIYLNAFDNKLSMKREKIADCAIWTGPKRYILSVVDDEGLRPKEPKVAVTGLEIVRTSTPAVCRKKLKEAVNLLLYRTEGELQDFVGQWHEEFLTLGFEDIAFPRGVNGLEKYGDIKTIYGFKTPAHTRAALLYNHHVTEKGLADVLPMINEGDKIKFCYLKLPNPIREDVIGCPEFLPKELELDKYLNKELQFEKAFLDPLKIMTDVVRWQPERISTLESFFS